MQSVSNISFEKVTFNSGFWKSRYDLNRDVSLKSIYDRFEETGRMDALRFNYEEGKPLHIFYDSDAAKWIEAVAYVIQADKKACEKEQEVIDALVLDMEKNQWENGYVNSYFIQIKPNEIFTDRNLHGLYCAGHLIEAAIAYDRATGKGKLLALMEKYVAFIKKVFMDDRSAPYSTPGHEELELALVKLYEYTNNKDYLDLAVHFINDRGVIKERAVVPDIFNNKYDQTEIPVRELELAEGHAVRAVYLYIAMCEVAMKIEDDALKSACERLFENIVKKRMYVTGGIGSGKIGECFTTDYDLPNLEAYSESCAAIGLALFALSMQKLGLNAKYASLIEQVMYNNMLSSTSIDGKAFFYENPLEYHLASVDKETCITPNKRTNLPIRHRLEVFGCSCCPPNIARVFARVGEFFFSEYEDNLVVNQYASLTLKNDKAELEMVTAYPSSGKVNIKVKSCKYGKIYLRKPAWCDKFTVSAPYEEKDGYIVVGGNENEIVVDYEMEPFFIESNPMVRTNCGRVALMYGPTVYCVERVDNDYEMNALSVDVTKTAKPIESEGYLLPDFEIEAFVDEPFDSLYRKARLDKKAVTLRLRPYWTFANREECDMIVWLRAINK